MRAGNWQGVRGDMEAQRGVARRNEGWKTGTREISGWIGEIWESGRGGVKKWGGAARWGAGEVLGEIKKRLVRSLWVGVDR